MIHTWGFLTFWHMKLGWCLEFSPLTAPAPQLPSEISVRHPYPLGRPMGYFLHLPSSDFSVRQFSKAWPQLLWLTRFYKAQAGSKHKGHIWLGANEPVQSFRAAFIRLERWCLYLLLSLFSPLNYLQFSCCALVKQGRCGSISPVQDCFAPSAWLG